MKGGSALAMKDKQSKSGSTGGCWEIQIVLEHQLKKEDEQNAALVLDLVLKPELKVIRPLNTLAANDLFLTLQDPVVKSPGVVRNTINSIIP